MVSISELRDPSAPPDVSYQRNVYITQSYDPDQERSRREAHADVKLSYLGATVEFRLTLIEEGVIDISSALNRTDAQLLAMFYEANRDFPDQFRLHSVDLVNEETTGKSAAKVAFTGAHRPLHQLTFSLPGLSSIDAAEERGRERLRQFIEDVIAFLRDLPVVVPD